MDFLHFFDLVFYPFNFLMLLVGVSGGLILGATPGVSPTLAVALLIPFTFTMGPTASLILLGSVYSAAMTGGAISAILINVPGAPANIATLFDGHKMALNGRATEGLHYALLASGVGGVVGVFILIFLAPALSDMAMRFGPSEMFWVAVLGITVMGSVGSGAMVKGLFSGALGVWISCIGYSETYGVERYVFSPTLASGVNLVGRTDRPVRHTRSTQAAGGQPPGGRRHHVCAGKKRRMGVRRGAEEILANPRHRQHRRLLHRHHSGRRRARWPGSCPMTSAASSALSAGITALVSRTA